MKWIDALKAYNAKKGGWCVPKKGTPEHAEVLKIMKGGESAPKRKIRVSIDALQGKVADRRKVKISKKAVAKDEEMVKRARFFESSEGQELLKAGKESEAAEDRRMAKKETKKLNKAKLMKYLARLRENK